MIIPEGRVFSLVISFAFSIIFWYSVKRAKIKLPEVRRLAAMDAIEESIGRCAETGKPAHYTCGNADLTTSLAPMTIAGLNILGHVARFSARLGVPLIVTIMNPQTIPIHEDIVYQSYLTEGKPEEYNIDNIRYLSSEQTAYAAGIWGIFQRERPMSNMVIGPVRGNIYTQLEAGQVVGAITISGTARMTQVPICVIMSDYSLIGEEIYAADAYYTEEPLQRGYLHGQDIVKLLSVVIILFGSILSIFGIQGFRNLLAM